MTSLVLASRSTIRQSLLRGAGLSFDPRPSNVDEGTVKRRCLDQGMAIADIAVSLAEEKAQACTAEDEEYVIGADQILEFEGVLFDKPASLEEARERLLALGGRTHFLRSGLSLVRQGKVLWAHRASASLTMRPLKGPEVDDYLSLTGDRVLATVGGYELEGPGVRLFSAIEGDYFTILGLPLLPLLERLRHHQVIPW